MDYVRLPAFLVSLWFSRHYWPNNESSICSRWIAIRLFIWVTLKSVSSLRSIHLHVQRGSLLLNNAGVVSKIKDCEFYTKTHLCLSQVRRPKRLKIALQTIDTTDAVHEIQPKTNMTKLRLFSSLSHVFWAIVSNFAPVATRLHRKFCKDLRPTYETLDKKEMRFLNMTKVVLISPLVLALPKSTGHMHLALTLANSQVECLLIQQQLDKNTTMIGYSSRPLTGKEHFMLSITSMTIYGNH